MTKFIIGLLLGVVVGGVAAFFIFTGGPHAAQPPGVPITPPDEASKQAATAQIVLRQEAFNQVLDAIFRDMNAPSLPIANGSTPGCENRITILNEGSGVKTRLAFDNNKIAAPLAFSGSYPSMFGCMQFTGRAEAALDLRFDPDSQAVVGQVNVETVDLDGVNPFFSALLTPVVQSTLNERVNPVPVIDGRQLAVALPIQATAGTLNGKVTDVRAEVKDNALNLYVTYSFSGTKM
jgi:hypothetical protein